jgi:hypothetical protein
MSSSIAERDGTIAVPRWPKPKDLKKIGIYAAAAAKN